MLRALLIAALLFMTLPASDQALSVLHIKVVLIDADRKSTPVPRHALLVSDNPATAAPRLIITGTDGTADVNLRPGNYTVESDRPVTFHSKSYSWTQTVRIVAGRNAVLELNAENAEVETATSTQPGAAAPLEADPSFLLPQWQDSVVAVWTPTAHGSGFLIDSNGLVATTQRIIGSSTVAEVQLTPAVKVTASVLAADPARDIAVLWIDPKVVASTRAITLPCKVPAKPVVDGQQVFTIGVPLREEKGMTSGTVNRLEAHAIGSDFVLATGSVGGPVFTAEGGVVGITSFADDNSRSRRDDFRIVRAEDACEVLASAEKKMTGASAPSGTHTPVDPAQPFPVDALREASGRRAGNLSAYQVSTNSFDVTFITPVLTYAAQYPPDQTRAGGRRGSPGAPTTEQQSIPVLLDFANWSDYVNDFPPVLLARVTPRLVEGFWTTVARGAARTQGVAIPPIKHFRSGFSRLRAWCGDTEVAPIHPFKLEQRVSESDMMYEGLYAFDPGALSPECKSVKVVIYSDKDPEKGETRVVDPAVVQQVWQDFAPYRSGSR